MEDLFDDKKRTQCFGTVDVEECHSIYTLNNFNATII